MLKYLTGNIKVKMSIPKYTFGTTHFSLCDTMIPNK